ncbi:DNA mismatch repair protein MutT [Candidatus Parcubacteria bacterium]|nr:MAG: DNA mismatch repair protein MutT [Candidatus Parcubacteria bacterium]
MPNKIKPGLVEELNRKLKEDGIQKVVVGGIVFSGEKEVLLLERLPNEFKDSLVELPSGTIETGESIEDALHREVKEETGLEVLDIIKYVGYFDYLSSSGKKVRQLNFVISVNSDDVKVNPTEHVRFLRVNPNNQEFQLLNISNETKEVILNCL